MSYQKNYIIRPIALCEGERDMSFWTYRMNIGKMAKIVCYIWYIDGSDPVTLVDAGILGEHYKNAEFPMTTCRSLEDGLYRYGLKPEDIEQILVTHLHFDHMALAKRYKNAKFIVQKKELAFARNPHVFNAMDYNPDFFEGLNYKIVDGDTEIMPGIKVLLTPGHSPGGQSIQVETEQGRVVITGFCSQLSTFEQTPAMKAIGLEVAACGLHLDCREAYDSVLRVKRIADIIVPLHEPVFMDIEKIG